MTSGTWGKIVNWGLVVPPSRPSQQDLRRIASIAQRIPRERPVGVLGSTPEFRDLLYEMGFTRIHILDHSAQMFRYMSSLRVHESEETFVEGDWLEALHRYLGKFALILSDLTAGNVPYEKRREFYDAIAAALSHRGLFVDKNLINDRDLLPMRAIHERYHDAPINLLTANFFSCEALFCSELQLTGEVVNSSEFYERLGEHLTGARFTKLIEMSRLITPDGCLWYYGRPWRELSGDYGAGLKQVGRYDLDNSLPYYQRGYQYVFQLHSGLDAQ